MKRRGALSRPGVCARRGSILLVVSILLGIAMLALSSILIAASGHSRINFTAYCRERSFLLADSGLAAAVRELNDGRNGIMSRTQSHGYFQNTNVFGDQEWGFSTTVTDKSTERKKVVSTGCFGKQQATVFVDVEQTTIERNIHPLYAYAIYVANSSGDTNYALHIGGTGVTADVVNGDVYSGRDLVLSGDARLRLPESFSDSNGNGYWDAGEVRQDSGTLVFHSNALTQAEFDAYTGTVDRVVVYPNGRHDPGEAFVDTIGNGVYDPGEAFTDLDGDGLYGFGEPFTDSNGNGTYDAGESFTDHGNGRYDLGEVFVDVDGNGVWSPGVPGWTDGAGVWHPPIPAEPFADEGNGVYDLAETFEDRNQVYDPGEDFFDDRNGRYDYGTRVVGQISGMPGPATGQQAATGGATPITPPDLARMYYDRRNTTVPPADALDGWGHDIAVADALFDGNGRIMNADDPAHIFVKNPTDRTYTPVAGKDDYFLEDPTDPTYGSTHQEITVTSNGNRRVYYIDGNLYVHGRAADYQFRNPDTLLTIVAHGNIMISDEFRYKGGTLDPQDSLCLIALKDPGYTNSGNIFVGDPQFGTGGDVHAMLLAENDIVDNNLDSAPQPQLSVFGNMAAGNQLDLERTVTTRTHLKVMFDERIVDGSVLPPGLPAALPGHRRLRVPATWEIVPGTWFSYSNLR